MNLNDNREIRLKTDVENVSLTINQAIPCSLLLNELVVNAYKHAFEDQNKGEILVKLLKNEDIITLTVTDNGKGFELQTFRQSDTLGVQLIDTLVQQLNGELEIITDGSAKGSEFQLSFQQKER